MEPITYNIRLDASKSGAQAVLNAKKGDTRTRRIVAHIYSGTTPFELPEAGAVATLWAAKPDGTRVYKLADVSGGGIAVTLSSQMLAAVGRVNCELQVIGPDGEVLTTPRFDIEVEDAMADDAPESTDEFTALTEALSRVASIEESEAARAEAEAGREEAEKARVEAEAARGEALDAAVDAAGDAVTEMIAEADASVAAAVESADAAAKRANAAAKAAEDVTAGAVGWDTIPDKPEVFPPGEHVHAIDEVTGLVDELIAKAPLESPVFAGVPEAPTAAADVDTAQIATTEFVHDAVLHDIAGKRARGTAVAIDGVIPDTALTEFVVHGKSTQAAVPSPDVSIPTGNNLFRGVGMPNDEEGYWDTINTSLSEASSDGFAHWKRTADQTENGSRYAALAAFPTVQPATEYKILVEFRNVIEPPSVSFIINANRSTTQPVGVFSEYLSISGQTITEGYRKVITATTRDVFEADGLPATIALGTTVTASEGTSYDFEARISIYPADYDVTEYEPYTGGPVEIESAEVGSAWVCGKNLISRPYSKPAATLYGLTFTENEDGSITINGTNTTSSLVGYSIKFGENSLLLPAGKYFSGGPEYVDNKIIMRLGKGKGGVSHAGFVNNTYLTSLKEGSFTLSEATYVSVTIGVGAGLSLTNYTVYPRLTKFKEQLAEYEPPGATCPINLTLRGIPVDSGGNYTDADGQAWICDTYDAATGEYVRRVQKIELTGNEEWTQLLLANTDSYWRWALSPNHPIKKVAPNALSLAKSSHYKTTTSTDGSNGIEGVSISSTNDKILICDVAHNTANVETWAAYLAELYAAGTPATVIYALAEPVTTHLPPQYIRAFSPVTNAAAGGAEIAVEFNNVAGSAYKPPSPVAVTLAAADWTGDAAPYSQTVTAAGAAAKAGSAVETAESATDAQYTAALDAKLRRAAQSGADVTIKAYGTKPAIDIPILL